MKSDCFLHWITQLLIWHWETQSYAQHAAFDNAYKSFKKLIDKYIEVYQGKNPRLALPDFEQCPSYGNVNSCPEQILWFKSYLMIDLVQDIDKTQDTDLLTIRDEMLSELNHLSYLLTLR